MKADQLAIIEKVANLNPNIRYNLTDVIMDARKVMSDLGLDVWCNAVPGGK
jgi:hypothetical protein